MKIRSEGKTKVIEKREGRGEEEIGEPEAARRRPAAAPASSGGPAAAPARGGVASSRVDGCGRAK
ncbi:hypothetical protein Syun_028086 [Stephania yunnanensis]|uniref:Uncharacterized protein n=1 Tax=Stephania yunnanensis TaxID=152371 RepID=A0AAP0EGQ5_9MAGN